LWQLLLVGFEGAPVIPNCCFEVLLELLWYISGVGGVVLMYHPHWGLSTPLLVASGPKGRVGMINPLLSARFILGIYRVLSFTGSIMSASARTDDLVLLMADFTDFEAVVDVAEW
jgi:hypothetical protein